MTVLTLVIIAALLVALLMTRWQRNLARAQWDLAREDVARREHETTRLRAELADMTASRDEMALTNAALRGEWSRPGAWVADEVTS